MMMQLQQCALICFRYKTYIRCLSNGDGSHGVLLVYVSIRAGIIWATGFCCLTSAD